MLITQNDLSVVDNHSYMLRGKILQTAEKNLILSSSEANMFLEHLPRASLISSIQSSLVFDSK